MPNTINLDKTYQYLLIILAFLMPLTVFGGNLIIVFICLLWLFSGNYKYKYNKIISSKLMIASILFYVLHVIGLIWTEDIDWGLHILHKMWYFLLLLPIFFTIVKEEYITYYIAAFISAMALSTLVSFLIWFHIIPPIGAATINNPTAFMSHISYNPLLAFCIYILGHKFFFNKQPSSLVFWVYGFLFLVMSINMFITGGRAGQVGFFFLIALLIFQFFNQNKLKSLLVTLLTIPLIFFSAYQSSEMFQGRVNDAIYNTLNYANDSFSPIGLRITFAKNGLEIIKNNPIIGVGTGDFPAEYAEMNQMLSPEEILTTNPHNMYILIGCQLGLIGLVSMLSIFYYQVKMSFRKKNRFIKDTAIALPLFFLVIMLSDTYILGHFTSLFFVFFSSFLHKDFEKT